MFKKFLTGAVAVFFAAGLAAASNISLLSGPQDPSQLLATVNTLIQSINFGVNGRLTAVVTPAMNGPDIVANPEAAVGLMRRDRAPDRFVVVSNEALLSETTCG